MDEEFKNVTRVWVSAMISVSYCYYISSRIRSGVLRFLFVLPVCALFLVLPLFLSTVHFSGLTAFFLSWLANFKLILLAFDRGPLCPLPPNLSRFICYACLPIQPRQIPNSHHIQDHQSTYRSSSRIHKWGFSIKLAFLCVLLYLYDYRENLPQIVVLILYSLHVYLELDLLLALVKVLVKFFLKCEFEPQFNEPYLATSLQDFWGRRWNLMVPAILRPSVYLPVRQSTEFLVGPSCARLLGILSTFVVSGLVHEVIFYYVTRHPPTWEVTWFFVLHGLCTAAEMVVRLRLHWRLRLGTVAARLMTVGFVVVTGGWLFFPQLIRGGC